MDKPTGSTRTAPPTTPPSETTTPDESAAADETATAAAPRQPTDEDRPLLAFAQSFELTARDLYQAALDAGFGEGENADLFRALRNNHEAYANVLSGLLGVAAPQRRDNALYDEWIGSFESGDLATLVDAGIELEATAVATHTDLIGRLTGLDGATRLAAMLVVEARHGTALADLSGDGLDALRAPEAQPLQPTGSEG